MIPTDYSSIFPELNGFLITPLLVNPPMCKLKELQDGTYSLYDVEIMHQILQLKGHDAPSTKQAPVQAGSIYG
jgi:hypothetical protein